DVYKRQVQQFIAAIEGRGAPAPSLQDGASAQAVLDAVLESTRSSSWVTVEAGAH
ncbi:MAG: gfo/Idh/MocA family oxidoreductase, partial [Betaproteobacteria bacterium]|nr:gfo/Idh/MocA family oxidoreductase [Betaproteobacteria bacterium]